MDEVFIFRVFIYKKHYERAGGAGDALAASTPPPGHSAMAVNRLPGTFKTVARHVADPQSHSRTVPSHAALSTLRPRSTMPSAVGLRV
jgi:hypothetical protein